MIALFKVHAHNVDSDRANSLVALAYAINSQEDLPLPHLPVDNLSNAAKIWVCLIVCLTYLFMIVFFVRIIFEKPKIIRVNKKFSECQSSPGFRRGVPNVVSDKHDSEGRTVEAGRDVPEQIWSQVQQRRV